jgi:hypothetical protein
MGSDDLAARRTNRCPRFRRCPFFGQNAGVSTPIALPPSSSPPKKKRSPALAILLGVGIPCVSCSLLGACIVVVALLPGTKLPIDDADRAVVLTATDLAEWLPDAEVDEAGATFEKTKDLFGVYGIEYEYSSDVPGLFVNTTVSLEPSVSDAQTTFSVTKLGLNVGIAIETKDGMTKVERNDLFTYGDESANFLLEMNGQTVGNAVVVRSGRRTFFVIFAGVYFEDAEDLDAVLAPHLAALETWTP